MDPLKLRRYDPAWAEVKKDKILALVKAGQGEVLFITLEGQIIGFVYYRLEDALQQKVHLSKLFIEEDIAVRATGRRLWSYSFQAEKKGIPVCFFKCVHSQYCGLKVV